MAPIGVRTLRVFKILIASQETGALLQGDAIEYEGKLWLVPEWNAFLAEGVQRPARIVCLDGLDLQPAGEQYPADYVLQTILPTPVLMGQEKVKNLVVVEAPDLSVPLPPEGRH